MSQASLPELHAEERQPLTCDEKGHLLAFLEDLKDHEFARLFLDRGHLSSLGLPRYPQIIKPTLDLGTIESRLRENKYHTTEDLTDDFKSIVENSREQWERSAHVMQAAKEAIQSSKMLLRAVETFVKHLPALASLGIKPRQLRRRPLQPAVTLSGLNNEQVERLTTKISQIEIMHQKSFLLPRDNQRPMQELSKVRRDIMGSNFQTIREVWHMIDTLHGASESTNGSQHRITLLIHEAFELVSTLLKEATPEAESLEQEGLRDEKMLDSPEPLTAPDEPPLTKKEKYIKQQQEKYRAGERAAQKRAPRNLIAERISERAIKMVGIESEASDEASDEIGDDIEDEIEADATEDEVTEKRHSLRDNTKGYTESLEDLLLKGLPTMEQIHALETASLLGPNFLGRTASLTSGKRFGNTRQTNGSTSQDLLLPAADTNQGYDQHEALADMSEGEIIYMTGHHLAWADLRGDELLSYSTDMLFLLVHALGRANRGQGGVTIQIFNCRKARTVDGERAAFYHALDIYTIFEIPKWSGWQGRHPTKLHPRKFTHEFPSHGTIRCEDSSLKQATLEDLVRDGLFDIFPPLQTPEDHMQEGLYTAQVVFRRIGYPPRGAWVGEAKPPIYSYENCPLMKAMSVELLQTVRKVTLNFRDVADELQMVEAEPPLHAFIGHLTFEKRKRADPVFTQWIKQHYTGKSHFVPPDKRFVSLTHHKHSPRRP